MDTEILWAAIRIIIVLPLVTALAYFLIKYGLAKRFTAYGGQRRMRVIEQISLGPKTLLSLVEVGGHYILLAHSDGRFQIIREMEELPTSILTEEVGSTDLKVMLDLLKKKAGNSLLGKYLARFLKKTE